MATKLIRGMGSFFKTCSCKRQGGCAHPYAIRFRDGTGRQCEESGYPTQDDALDRLTQIYRDKRSTPVQQSEMKRTLGKQRFEEYASTWLPRQRHFAPGTVRTVKQLLDRQILPTLESRRINSFSPSVVDDFIMSMEERKVGLATQQNAFDTLKKILRDAHRRGGITDDPFQGVVPPEYIPNRVTIPTLEEIHALKEVGSTGLVVVIDLMSGCGHRNGEAYAASLEGMVADDVYRITEQIDGRTHQRAPLKHRKPGEFREAPMPATTRESLLRYAREVGADENGFLLRTQRSPYWSHSTLDHQWNAAKQRAGITRKLNPYSLRHFFASNCLSRGIPITDVAEWMGHSNINMTYRIYRHLMPASIGHAAKALEAGL
ncbi:MULTISPECIES: tyrosine-type recombinase/integrase [unclassified Streptomyces]|uniref:tyrosine-type recombinase/integrase n=1 Tax=unclassified Streptomyces TaxID=2593676 RepID=UPI00224D2974|nr:MULTISPECIES: tyrosine-type recombinase/integrase [unclassified Streptomyces]MCX4398883.1 site-specific integrase [Streptomyces sp. NBC_01767]WSP51170.1 site-specific integrase [Streptomyces sp. NBC_01243]